MIKKRRRKKNTSSELFPRIFISHFFFLICLRFGRIQMEVEHKKSGKKRGNQGSDKLVEAGDVDPGLPENEFLEDPYEDEYEEEEVIEEQNGEMVSRLRY
jgi:hypothetical protein